MDRIIEEDLFIKFNIILFFKNQFELSFNFLQRVIKFIYLISKIIIGWIFIY